MNKADAKNEVFISRLERLSIVRVTRDALVHIIPVLIIGAFALIIKTDVTVIRDICILRQCLLMTNRR